MDYSYYLSKEIRKLYLPWLNIDELNGEGYLLLPNWKKWGLAVPITKETTDKSFLRLVWLQNMVAGVLSHSKEKAKLYEKGKLYYYTIVEDIEAFFGCGRLC